MFLSAGCGDEENLDNGEYEEYGESSTESPDSSPPRHSCHDASLPEPKPTDLNALRRWESDRLQAEQAFYEKYGRKSFTCPKTGIQLIWLVDAEDSEKGFWISAHEISGSVHDKLMKNGAGSREESQLPMTNLSPKKMQAFCQKLTECWRRSRPEKLPDIYKFDLPTRYEWWQAAGGAKSYRGMDSSKANFNGGFPPPGTKVRGPNLGRLAPVTDYPANKQGVFNIWGNAKEIFSYYQRTNSPQWYVSGGSYLSKGNNLGSYDSYDKPAEDIGFRVVVAWTGPGPSQLDDPE